MLIKIKKTWKDLADNKPRHESSPARRDFIARGLATCAFGIALPELFLNDFVKRAHAADIVCPAPTLAPGSIVQMFSDGGPTMGARFISDAQAASMNATMAANYGISGQANLVKLGPNLNIDKTSPFGFVILQGPPGYTGGSAAWQANVLSKLSGGGHLGPFNQDDGAGDNTGLVAGVSPFKASQMGKDLKIGVSKTLATWANGLPAAAINSATPANLAKTFSLTPAAVGLTNTQALTNATTAANSIAQALAPMLGTNTRKGGAQLLTNAGCGFANNAPMADPNFGTTLFTATGITALTSKLTVANLSTQEQAQLAAFYQSAKGVAGGVIMQFNGRDYHGNDPQNDIAPKDIEEARAIVMQLAALDAAQAKGALIYTANGQAIASGVQSVTATLDGATVTMNAPVAKDDAGGAYNAGLIMFYDPKGAPPAAKFTGTLNTTDGSAKVDPVVASSKEAMAGLYLSALQWVNGTIPQTALTAMNAAGVASATARAKSVVF